MNSPETTPGPQPMRLVQIPTFYFNGFQLGLSNADVSGLLLLDNEPTLKLNMSYTTAKTLVTKLQDIIDTLERVTGREIMTTEDAGKGLESLQAPGGQ